MAYQYQPLGVLNRLRAHIVFPERTDLNIQPAQLTNEGIHLNLEGNATDLLQGMIGLISSPAPYMQASITMALIRTMPVAQIYKGTMETNTLCGLCNIFPDIQAPGNIFGTRNIPAGINTTYDIYNCAIESVREIAMTGLEAAIVVTVRGYYPVNTDFYLGIG